jgi:transcription factor CON7
VGSEEEQDAVPPDTSVSKTYSFVSLPGNAVRKRPRRRYDEIERLYHCSWSGCTKSYGTLNHLNAHIVMQRHGGKRTPAGEIHGILRN